MSDEETSTATPTSSLPKSGGDSSSEDLPSSEQVSPAPAATVASPLDDDGTDWTSLIYSKGGTPFAKREETVKALRALMGTAESRESAAAAANASTTTMDAAQQRQQQQQTQRHPLSNVHGAGPLFLSNIPKSSTKPGVCVGIDEAGRGSVLGPMVYGAAFWNASLDGDKKKIPPGFNDSKQLTEGARETLLEQLLASEDIGFAVRVLHASEISRNMLRAGRS